MSSRGMVVVVVVVGTLVIMVMVGGALSRPSSTLGCGDGHVFSSVSISSGRHSRLRVLTCFLSHGSILGGRGGLSLGGELLRDEACLTVSG